MEGVEDTANIENKRQAIEKDRTLQITSSGRGKSPSENLAKNDEGSEPAKV